MTIQTNLNININSVSTIPELGKAFVELVKQRETWEAGTYAASNAELYALLGQTLTLLYRVKRSTELSRGLNGFLTKLGFTFTDATSTETKLLRAVFCDPAKPNQYKHRIYVYARVLAVAFEAKVTGTDLPEFIEQRGGIDEIRRDGSKAADKKDEKAAVINNAENALTFTECDTIATGIKLTADLMPADDQKFSLALLRMEADGTGSIVFGTNSKALVRSVLAIAGQKIDLDAEAERKRRRAAEAKTQREADTDAFCDAVSENAASSTITADADIFA
jgi:hypothetical protein